ncbi:MAG: hypothetical protein QNJ54_26840 [Prochloraceae cyanobacterium]|nr:hypothetical protein [Prochloraceae cyanobacterium]
MRSQLAPFRLLPLTTSITVPGFSVEERSLLPDPLFGALFLSSRS